MTRTNLKKIFEVLFGVQLLVIGLGCETYGRIRSNFVGYRYTIVFYNASAHDLSKVAYVDAPATVPCGILPPEVMKSSSCFFDVPKTATISWTDHSGKEHLQTLPVRSKVQTPELFEGAIVFKMTDSIIELIVLADRNSFYDIRPRDTSP